MYFSCFLPFQNSHLLPFSSPASLTQPSPYSPRLLFHLPPTPLIIIRMNNVLITHYLCTLQPPPTDAPVVDTAEQVYISSLALLKVQYNFYVLTNIHIQIPQTDLYIISLKSKFGEFVKELQYDWENHEHLKYFKNVYCVKTNHSKDQDMRTSHRTTN